jgi:hypothetical protein
MMKHQRCFHESETSRLENGRFLSMPQHSSRTHGQQVSLIQTGLQLHQICYTEPCRQKYDSVQIQQAYAPSHSLWDNHYFNGPIQLQAPGLSDNALYYIPEEHNPDVATLTLSYHLPYSSISGFNSSAATCGVTNRGSTAGLVSPAFSLA